MPFSPQGGLPDNISIMQHPKDQDSDALLRPYPSKTSGASQFAYLLSLKLGLCLIGDSVSLIWPSALTTMFSHLRTVLTNYAF